MSSQAGVRRAMTCWSCKGEHEALKCLANLKTGERPIRLEGVITGEEQNCGLSTSSAIKAGGPNLLIPPRKHFISNKYTIIHMEAE